MSCFMYLDNHHLYHITIILQGINFHVLEGPFLWVLIFIEYYFCVS